VTEARVTKARASSCHGERILRTQATAAAEGGFGGEDLAVINGDDWRHIVRIPGLPSLILDQVERGGLDAVNELLNCYSAGQARPPEMLRYLE
jgi:hypothetical protein